MTPVRWRRIVGAVASMVVLTLPGRAAAQVTSSTLRGDRTDAVLVLSGQTPLLSQARSLSEFVRACRVAFEISPGDSISLVRRATAAPMDSAALAGGVLVLHLLAVEALAPSCARGEAGAVAATLGLRASFDSTFAANETVQSVEFVHGGKSLTPVSLERLPVQRLWGGGLREAGSQWIRAVIRLDDLSVRADAGMTDLTIEVQLGPDGLRDRVVVPTQVLLDFWLAELPRRSEGLRAAPQQFALSVPRDDRLRAARESFAKGDLADAIQNSLERVKGPGLTDADKCLRTRRWHWASPRRGTPSLRARRSRSRGT